MGWSVEMRERSGGEMRETKRERERRGVEVREKYDGFNAVW